MFLMGGGASSEQQAYQAYQAQQQPADPAPRNHLPRLYSKSDMMKEVWKFLHKPRYVDVGQLGGQGRTAAQVATAHGKHDVAELLQGLGVDDAGVGLPVEGSSNDDGNDSNSGEGGGAVLI